MQFLKKKLILTINIDKAWQFFSRPENLNLITPSYMNFKILNQVPENMYEGLLIIYKVSPIMNIPITWITKITEIKEKKYFIDEQIKGPYKIWHHEHHFEEVDKNKTLMTDLLYYDVGYGFIGNVIENLLVKKKVNYIFEYREIKLQELFKDS